MKLVTFCVLLPFATVVQTAPVRVRRENVLNFLNDALGTTTEKTIPATTADRNPPSKPTKEQDSEDMSEAKSIERFDTNGHAGAFKDPDSHETMIREVVDKDKAPSRRKTGADKDNMRLVDMNRGLVQDQGSRELGGPHGELRASREQTDLNSEEGMTVNAQPAEKLPGKQVDHLSRDQVTVTASLATNLRRKATLRRVNGLTRMLGQSREVLDRDSLEDNNGRPAPVGNRGDADYDETREFISSETYPTGAVAPPEHIPSRLSVPAKSRTS